MATLTHIIDIVYKDIRDIIKILLIMIVNLGFKIDIKL